MKHTTMASNAISNLISSQKKYMFDLVIYKNCIIYSVLIISLMSCKKLVEVDPPITSTTSENVFTTNATATAVLNGVYIQLSSAPMSFLNEITSFSLYGGLSSDEFELWSGINEAPQISYYRNDLSISQAGYEYWNVVYPKIYICNSAIEGLMNSESLTPNVKQQLLGESMFLRAFFYFYLVNLYGDVPLVRTTDFKMNSSLPRSSSSEVYTQIVSDLRAAQAYLNSNYLNGSLLQNSNERVRPNKWAATALLSRVYLYLKDYENAEKEATSIINNTTLYTLTSLNSSFLKNNKEAIWQLQPVNAASNTEAGKLFIIPASGLSGANPVELSKALLNSAESGDLRMKEGNWINKVTIGGIDHYFPYKYKINATNTNITSPAGQAEYFMVLRLGEQYLIRAEARAQLKDIAGSRDDLNKIRQRAGLADITTGNIPVLIKDILHERQIELFSEWGHRWLDIKRTNMVDSIMTNILPLKGGTWNPRSKLYPIPRLDIQKNVSLTQNEGY